MPRHNGAKRRVSRARRRSTNALDAKRRSHNRKGKRRTQADTRTLDRLLGVVTPPAPGGER